MRISLPMLASLHRGKRQVNPEYQATMVRLRPGLWHPADCPSVELIDFFPFFASGWRFPFVNQGLDLAGDIKRIADLIITFDSVVKTFFK